MIIGEIMAIIDGIGRVKNLLLNEEEKQIIKDLVLKFDESNLFDPKNDVKYALIGKSGNLSKLYIYENYLKRHASIISKALGKTNNKQLIEKLSGFRTMSKEFIRLAEQFEVTEEEIKQYRGKELPRLRETIDRYRWLMSQCIMTLMSSIDLEVSTIKKENFERLIESIEMS